MSATTASYILNGRSAQMRIAPDTQRRVLDAAAALRYRPNPSARSLRTARTRTVGVISDLIAGGPFGSAMLTGASAAARRLDHVLVIGETQGDRGLEALLIEEMLDRRVDGVVYATVVTSEIILPAQLAATRVVLLNCVDPAAKVPAVVPDDYQGGRVAARAMVARRGGEGLFVVGNDVMPGAVAGGLRLAGIRDELATTGHQLAGLVLSDWTVAPAYDAVASFLDEVRPRGLICMNDRIAMGAYQALTERGLTVPDDVAVVSFDGSDLASWLRPRLTTVTLPYGELGARAIELLLDPAAGATPPGTIRIPMPLQAGGSVAPR